MRQMYAHRSVALLLLLSVVLGSIQAYGQAETPPVVTEADPAGEGVADTSETAVEETAAPAEEVQEVPDEESAVMEVAEAEEDAAGPRARDWVQGTLGLGADAAWSDRDSKVEFYQSLRLRLRNPEHPDFSLVTSMTLYENVGSTSRSSALRNINDAYNGDVQLRLFDLYAQQERLWGNTTIRLGRQRISDSPWYNRIDGLHVKQYHQRWDWYAYIGARSSVYRNTLDDFVTGGGASYRLTDSTRLGLDILYTDEDRDLSRRQRYYNPVAALVRRGYPRRISPQVSDTQIALSVWHDFTPNIRFFGRFQLNDGDADEFLLDLTGHYEAWDLSYQVTYRQQLQRITDRGNDLTSYYRILGPERAFKHLSVTLHKPLSERVVLSLEGELHDAKADDWMSANRDYWRLAAILSAKPLYKGVDASIALERWDVDEGEGVWAVTGELRKEIGKWNVFLGADYERYRDQLLEYNPWPNALYQFSLLAVPGAFPRVTPGIAFFDTVRVRTREDIYSIYTGFNYEWRDNQTVRTKVIFEDDESSDSPYWRVQASYEIKF